MKEKLITAVIAFLIVLLGVLLFLNQQKENKQEAHMKQLHKEVQPYNEEIADIRSELKKRENEIKKVPDVAGAIVGFIPTSVDDISTVKQLTAEYAFTPLIILDCAMEENVLQEIAKKTIAENCDLVLAGISFDQAVLEKANSIRKLLPEYGYEKEINFFLRYPSDTEENREALRQHGYPNLIRYNTSLNFGIDELGIPYISYGVVDTSNPNVSFISQIIAAHSYTVIVFDFADINDEENSQAVVMDFLQIVENEVSNGGLLYMDIREAFSAVMELESLYQKQREEFEQYKTDQQKRIEELEEMIAEIYSHWDEY